MKTDHIRVEYTALPTPQDTFYGRAVLIWFTGSKVFTRYFDFDKECATQGEAIEDARLQLPEAVGKAESEARKV